MHSFRQHMAFPATMDGAADAAAWLRNLASREHLPGPLTFALEVCLEELATNVARHGNPRLRGDALSIGISIAIDPEAVELVVEDNGIPFDVSQARSRPIRDPLDELAPGGLGMQLIRSFSHELQYEPAGAGNRTTLKFFRQTEGASPATT